MTTNSQLLTTEPKKPNQTKQNKKQSKPWNRNIITKKEITLRVISREGERGEWGKRYRE